MKTYLRIFLLINLLFLAACEGITTRKPAPTNLPPVNTMRPIPSRAIDNSTPAKTPTPTAALQVLPITIPPVDPAAVTAEAYAATLQEGNYDAASQLLSSFSLMVEQTTRSEISTALQLQMAREEWSEFQVREVQPYSERLRLVHVLYQVEMKDAKTGQISQRSIDELWPVRLENGQWLYNYGNLIDFRTLDVPEQTTGGLTIKPRQLTRYSDRIRLTLLVQNQTNEPIVLGQVNENMAIFLFGEQKIEAEKAQFVFDHLRSYPDIAIELKGQFEQYPDGIIIRQWKNVNVAPWYTFEFHQ